MRAGLDHSGLLRNFIGRFVRRPGPRIAVNLRPRPDPWGGGNQFVEQFDRRLSAAGYSVVYHLDEEVDGILLIDPRPQGDTSFKIEEIRSFKERHPGVPIIHRVNDCDKRKNTQGTDESLGQGNAIADMTVFISEWLRDYFVERWFDPSRPHQVIGNGADPTVFFPDRDGDHGRSVFRLVTHHWSPNWMKGFKVYQEVDRLIADGELAGVSLSVIGRWPDTIQWRAAELFEPTRGQKLAGLLRSHHAYLTASLWEPGGMHHIEGAQCGLPVIFHWDGGGIVEFGRRYGVGFDDDVGTAIREMRADFDVLRSKVLADPPSGTLMCDRYLSVVREMVPIS